MVVLTEFIVYSLVCSTSCCQSKGQPQEGGLGAGPCSGPSVPAPGLLLGGGQNPGALGQAGQDQLACVFMLQRRKPWCQRAQGTQQGHKATLRLGQVFRPVSSIHSPSSPMSPHRARTQGLPLPPASCPCCSVDSWGGQAALRAHTTHQQGTHTHA